MTKLPEKPPDLTREELWALVRELGTGLMEAEKQIALLRDEIARLRIDLKPPSPSKTSQNSSQPPSRDPKARIKDKPRKKHGAKPGHKGVSRPPQDPDQIIECVAQVCPHCGHDLAHAPRHLLSTRPVVELPPIQPLVYEIRQYRHRCQCGACVDARLPQGYQYSGLWSPSPRLTQLLQWDAPHRSGSVGSDDEGRVWLTDQQWSDLQQLAAYCQASDPSCLRHSASGTP